MRKLLLILLLLLFSITIALFPGKVAVFNQLGNPSALYVHKDHLYIIEFPDIYVYSQVDYRLIKKFGRQGEGPGEFIRYARLHFFDETIIVQSQTKFSYFTKDWNFIKDKKTPIGFNRGAKPMGNQWVVCHTGRGLSDPDQIDLIVNIYMMTTAKKSRKYTGKNTFSK